MWLFHSDFPSCSESTEIWHVYSFWVKKCPCVFFSFQECRKIWIKLHQIQPPPPPPLYVSKQCRISILENQNTVRVSFTLLVRGRGGSARRAGGGPSRTCLKPCFPACRKNAGTFFHRKGVSMPNFSRFWATWKIATKSHIGPACTEPFNCQCKIIGLTASGSYNKISWKQCNTWKIGHTNKMAVHLPVDINVQYGCSYAYSIQHTATTYACSKLFVTI